MPVVEFGLLRIPSKISLEFFRRRLADVDALPQLAVLAVVAGLLTGMVILVFRTTVDYVLDSWLLAEGSESFETLAYFERLALPILGAAIIGGLLTRLAGEDLRVGVVHVMERLSRHQGYLPPRNAIVQFVGGVLALISGQSGGREGPAIHLGAASSSLLGQAFELPNNSIRTLVACGTAAAIASSFNTPIAGVIFAMEVVMMEYTIGSFIPVIIAAVTSTLLTHYVIGNDPAFVVAPLQLYSMMEIPFVTLAGIAIGCVAAGFIVLVQLFAKLDHWPFWIRALLAGSITGLAAISTPQIMGVGYDTVNGAMLGELTLVTLLLIVVMKSLASAGAVGLGLPVGLIGPTFVIGAGLGGLIGIIGNYFDPLQASSEGFYVMLGMAAMMAAVLQAPLAALMAVLELTANPNLILPAMLIIVVATMVTSVVFRQKSVYLATLHTLGLDYPPGPVTLHMQRAGVAAIMCRELVRVNHECSVTRAHEALKDNPRWIVVETKPGDIRCVLNANDLAAYLEEHDPDQPQIDLLQIPAMRKDVVSLDSRATVEQAQQTLANADAEALCVRRISTSMIDAVLGVITQEDIDNYRDVNP
ncbi:MAG: chloride channel protein [Gammaproteobacteria bacterium]|nr:chloride channel protein [Gammaproteobacteria bacterium]